jgi:hypothetical protein
MAGEVLVVGEAASNDRLERGIVDVHVGGVAGRSRVHG